MVIVSAEVQDQLVAQLCARREQHGSLSKAEVAMYAAIMGCSERHVYRLIQQAESACQRSRYQLSELLLDGFFENNGNAKAAHKQIADSGIEVPSVRTVQRVIQRELTAGERAFAKYGEEGRRNHSVYVAYEVTHRNELWIGDGKELDTLVVTRRGGDPVRPWMFSILDAFTRACMGFVVTPMPDAHDVVAALRDAVTLQPTRGPFHGMPDALQYDNALAHLSNLMLAGCALLGIGHGAIAPYSAYLNGKLERFHRTIRDEFSGGLPFFTHAPTGVDGEPLHPAGEPIHIGVLVELLMDFVVNYNCERPHRALGGRTPQQAWQDDPTPIREPEELNLRLLALPSERRKVGTRGIGFRSGHYVAPELNAVFGDEVEVRYAPHDDGWVEVFHDDRWLCTAVRSSRITHAGAGAVARQREQDGRRADAAMRRRLMRDELKLAELKELESLRPEAAAGPKDGQPVPQEADPALAPAPASPRRNGRSRPGSAADVLEAFGLLDDLNQAREDSKEGNDA